ncbi:uncharacterized protein LOC135435790 [Drosophila montana]|uniref:uncharacterized protein LOC135435790 n=1 Tax=Drosophila montana TaxID=40370 RepID=UPI00313CBF7F
MSLSTALIPQQRQPCNRKSAQIFARIFEQRYGNWSYMKSRSICRTTAVVEQQASGLVRCVNQVGIQLQTQRSASLLALQRQQLLAVHNEDYRIYPQSVDLDAFFGEEQKCEKVSDVCLLNDHFMLVKMPQEQLAKEFQPAAVELQRKLGSRLPRCFKCYRGSRVSPILEEQDASSPTDYRPWNSYDHEDVEVFASSTRIVPAYGQQQMPTSSTPASKSVPESVIVEQPLPQRSALPAPMQLQLETLQSPPPADASAHASSRGPLHWFLWPFRRRLASRPRAQLAAVHKTYFVSWNKPPDTLWHGYGVERARVDKVVLRRCRSAIF